MSSLPSLALLSALSAFAEVWCYDYEFGAPPGERPTPVCLVAKEIRSGRVVRMWQDELIAATRPPFSTGNRSLSVAFYSSAEIGCNLSLGWPVPVNILDLYVEFRCLTNGRYLPDGRSIIGALNFYGLPTIDVSFKESMRKLAQKGGGWTDDEKRSLLTYCESDVDALIRLLPVMMPSVDLPRALLRGRAMAAAARMEATGVPIDTPSLSTLRAGWDGAQEELIRRVDRNYGVYDGTRFSSKRFASMLASRGIPWPRTESGRLDLQDKTFRSMAIAYPELTMLQELRASMSRMRLFDLAVGSDSRNRLILSAFRARTGRFQPSNSAFVFGPAVWIRGLIKPPPGYGIFYADWEQQEFAIGGAESGDERMQEAYLTGDPYLAFAKQAGAVPSDATKESHEETRNKFKQCCLAVQYGATEHLIASRTGLRTPYARDLLRLHKSTYPRFWAWSDNTVDHAMIHNSLRTLFGWTLRVGPDPNPRSLMNFPIQAAGAEMLRLACCFAIESGVAIACPVHDALLGLAPLDELEHAVAITQRAMADASRIVLRGFELRSDVKIFRYPHRYADKRGTAMWNLVWDVLGGRRP